MNAITQFALNWLNQGIAVIPCHYRSKRPKVRWQDYQTQLPTEQQVCAWFAGEHTNLAVITGWQGLVILDFDSMDAYDLWTMWHATHFLHTEQPIFDNTLRVFTGRGVHLYLFVDEHVESAHVPDTIDIKASGYCLTAPSIHPNGRQYRGNDLPVARVKSLHGIVPDEWLECRTPLAQYGEVTPLAPTPMQRIDQCHESLVMTIRQRMPITNLLHDVLPTRDGWLVTRCPFHDDHEPSFWIDTKRQLCGCYAGCTSKPLDVINLTARLLGISNTEAIQELARRL